MKTEQLKAQVPLPEGVTATYDAASGLLTVKGVKGEVKKKLQHPKVAIAVQGEGLSFSVANATMREKKLLYTFKAHAGNLVKGATEGFTYKLKVCSGHFPMSVAVKGDVFEVKNFIGEKVPRTLKLKKGADVKVDGDAITVSGVDKEVVGQVAGDIEQLTKRSGFDSRIFQDGIFLVEKDGKQLV